MDALLHRLAGILVFLYSVLIIISRKVCDLQSVCARFVENMKMFYTSTTHEGRLAKISINQVHLKSVHAIARTQISWDTASQEFRNSARARVNPPNIIYYMHACTIHKHKHLCRTVSQLESARCVVVSSRSLVAAAVDMHVNIDRKTVSAFRV